MITNKDRLPRTDKMESDPKFNSVMVDDRATAYIPGSTLKGNMRAWITQLFTDMNGQSLACANDPARSDEIRSLFDVNGIVDLRKAKENLRRELKMIEFLFGSAANEGKLEFWDCPMISTPQVEKEKLQAYSGYDNQRGTMVMKSVAIDIKKGVAAKNKLYNFEVVPRGAGFNVTVSGQNLDDDELGMLLFALQGFNSFIFPLTLGAMGGIGFGRFRFDLSNIYCLDKSNYQGWVQSAIMDGHAGYSDIPDLKDKFAQKLKEFKQAFLSQCMGGRP
jgi:CRISPR/Cas system CSM-associated protein Csm3 (group 7 of RAMP superfamily)